MLYSNNDKNSISISILIVVILYKKSILESETLEFLNKQVNSYPENLKLSLAIVDNSEGKYIVEEDLRDSDFFKQYESVRLFNHYNNANLGVVYNDLISDNIGFFNYFNILDDDSILPPDFYANFLFCQNSNDYFVYAPKILKSENLLYSPKRQPPFVDIFNFTQSNNFPVGFVGPVTNGDVFAVMSGIFLKSDLFEDGFLFSNELKLYGLDNQLFLYLKKKSIFVYILPMSITHSPSYLAGDETIQKIRFRFTQRSFSRIRLATLFGINKFRVLTGVLVSALSMTVKHRHPGFFFDFCFVLFKSFK